ncbi:MAG: CpsD/CapB family tyrosine-protein kinase [Pseudomonadota bacterium]
MDRIRDAISRARTESGERPQSLSQRAQPAARTEPTAPARGEFRKVICDAGSFQKYRIISNEQDPVLNAFRVMRTRLLQKMEANNWRTVAVVSPGAGAGKTVTAINLSIALGAKQGIRPTLVDVDFYRPSVARYLGLSDFDSVLDFFEGKRALRAVTVEPDLPDVLVMPNERVTRRGAELLHSDKADELIDTAINEFGSKVVIFDMSPLLGCDDALAFLPKVDCVLLIAASGQTRVSELKEAKRILAKSNIVGTVLNKAPRSFMPNPYY